ncbi:hypothetical protein SERLA73DRAFT_109965 [Serpula lacrymans var. lacrymans S7.3]|uniref:Uncharacterized protein n=2 Tax=Serpula lacrymans var. lacrymans TaxID=341189 RepID=F8PZY8_SERL3|nr:uncharacterized protein SERLADRAFT_416268 [Serpula lacrymans var. lacrymans S7.9]EGN98460.1 hypothetical protein SERLA73DRAFT_109965 [Serpula lacrymans var. lacrymans S7.3]EGO24039.1 hypothetical protein SERLADRAFT_416268 [Serpula lacrymans var. lacrymans S7.9]
MASYNSALQNSFYIGNSFNCILYGIELVLYFVTMHNFLTAKKREHRRKSDRFFMCFSTALLLLITIYVATQSVFGEEMWIVNANYPGGDAYYAYENLSVWYETLGTAAFVALNLLGDGLLIARCWIIWGNYYIIIFPCFLWIATLGLGIYILQTAGSFNGSSITSLRVGIAYCAVSIGLNVFVSCIIIARMLYYARRAQRCLGSHISRVYFSIAAIIVESALPYSLFGIAFLVTCGLESGLEILFMSIYVMLTCIAPQMIVWRVISGRAWTKDEAEESTIMFSSRPSRPTIPDVSQSDAVIDLRNMKGELSLAASADEV